MIDRVGRHVGNYRIIRSLGRGGFAEIYLGEHLHLHSHAALKVLRTSLQDKDVQRFLAEAQTLVRLRHPHIVRVLDFAVEQGTPVLVMDYAPGGTVRQQYPRGSCLPLSTVVTYVKQVAAALQYAHNRNVIHRDVKPENLLLGSDQDLLLSDFGLALFFPQHEVLSTQEMAGTIPYMAPEQLRGKPCFASDQYALAIVAYEWLSGKRPFEGSPWEVAHQHLTLAPPRLQEQHSGLPTAVEEVIQRALAKDPQQRFVSVQAFAHALVRASQAGGSDDDAQTTTPLDEHLRSPFVTFPHPSFSGSHFPQGVFLSATPADAAFVACLKADLEARGIVVESTANTPGQQNAVRQAIRVAQLVLVVLSPHTRSSRTVKEHLQIASMYERPLVFVWAAGDEIAAVLPEAWGNMAVIDLIDARQTRYETALDELVASLDAEPSVTAPLEPEPGERQGEPRNPYKGLRAFTRDDAADFFGRDALIQELVETRQGMLTSAPSGTPGTRLLTVMGPSGSGKSSLVMAGLLPRLQSGALPGSNEWVYLKPMLPGQHPIDALTLLLSSHFPARSLKTIREDLEDDAARGLHLLATALAYQPGAKVVLLIDQFEELFTQTSTEEERRHFIDLLLTAMTEPRGPVIVILTLRADFYDRLVPYPELGRLIQKHHHLVFPMQLQDLRAVIEHPAALPDVQLTFEGNLVGDLLFEMQGQVGALPLLQFTLEQLFQRRNGHLLTLQAYQEIGGVKGALAKQAESTYMSLSSEEHRRLARALFLRLIDPGVTEQDTTRRRAALSEISLPDPKQTTILREVADAFIAARLLTTNEMAGTSILEVSHEALIRAWPRLADWLREGRGDIYLQQAVSHDVVEWEQRGRPKDRLYRGSQLREARAWARRNHASRQETAFLRASLAYRTQLVISMLALVLVLFSAVGVAGWFYRLIPPDSTLVTTLNDDGQGSLRWAIRTAPTGSTITFDASVKGLIVLTSNDLSFTKSLTIRGPGAHILAISGGKSGHIIHVLPHVTITLFGVSFINSDTGTAGYGYGFIENEGRLMISDSIISGNSAVLGGGIANVGGGKLTVVHSVVSGNTAQDGGGIYNENELTLMNSTISGNTASKVGGGIYTYGSQMTITSCTISGNTADDGGGILIDQGNLPVKVTNSTIAGNHARIHPNVAGKLTLSQ